MLKLFAFQSKTTSDKAIYPAETSQEAFLMFIRDIAFRFQYTEKVSLLEMFELIPQEVTEV